MLKLLPFLMFVSACDIPSTNEIIDDTTTACQKIIDEKIPEMVARVTAEVTSALLPVCGSLLMSVDNAPRRVAEHVLMNLGCIYYDDTAMWSCKESYICAPIGE